jgi:hypothetical protein
MADATATCPEAAELAELLDRQARLADRIRSVDTE